MADASAIRGRMEVVGADGGRVGTVDRVADGRVGLARDHPGLGGRRHSFALGHVAGVDGGRVRLSVPAALAPLFWEAEEA